MFFCWVICRINKWGQKLTKKMFSEVTNQVTSEVIFSQASMLITFFKQSQESFVVGCWAERRFMAFLLWLRISNSRIIISRWIETWFAFLVTNLTYWQIWPFHNQIFLFRVVGAPEHLKLIEWMVGSTLQRSGVYHSQIQILICPVLANTGVEIQV